MPASNACIHEIDLKSQKIKKPDWALASLGVFAKLGQIINPEMLEAALEIKFKDKTLKDSLELVRKVEID